MSTGHNNSGTFPLLWSLLPNLVLICQIITEYFDRNYKYNSNCSNRYTFYRLRNFGSGGIDIRYLNIDTRNKRSFPMFDIQLFLRPQSLGHREQFVSYKDQSRLKIILERKVFIKQRLLLPGLKHRCTK
jgi:hypothetical protein